MNDATTSHDEWSVRPSGGPNGAAEHLGHMGHVSLHPQRANEIVEMAADGIWVIDRDGATTYVNSAMASMLGTTPEEMCQRSIEDFMDDESVVRSRVLLERRRAGIHESFHFRLRRLDGREVRTFVSTRPMLDASGDYDGAVSWVTDVTARLDAADRLAHSEAHLRGLLAAFPDPVFRMDTAGTFLEVHAGSARGRAGDLESRTGRTVREVFPPSIFPDVAQRHLTAISQALRFDHTTTIDYEVPAVDGMRAYEARFSPTGKDQVVAMVRDVTEVRRAAEARHGFERELQRRQAAEERLEIERELERASRLEAMGHLAGGVAHDVNNLLGVIANYASAIETSDPSISVRADLAEIRRAVERGAALTRRLLLVGRSDGTVERHERDVVELVAELTSSLRHSFGQGKELVVLAPRGRCEASIDHGRLEQAVMNLVVNARDALGACGRVTVSVDREVLGTERAEQLGMVAGESVVIRVADDGHGMDDEVRERAFRPFFTTKAEQGTGIGLTVVKHVADEHGGATEVVSSDAGTVVSIWLPAASPARRPSAPQVLAPVDSDRPVVLLVDDDDDVRRSTARLLDQMGADVIEAADGADALRLLGAGTTPDVVVTDVRMPKVSGPELARRVRAEGNEVPVVYVTGYADDLLRSAPEVAGALLTKPYDARRLARVLEGALGAPLASH